MYIILLLGLHIERFFLHHLHAYLGEQCCYLRLFTVRQQLVLRQFLGSTDIRRHQFLYKVRHCRPSKSLQVLQFRRACAETKDTVSAFQAFLLGEKFILVLGGEGLHYFEGLRLTVVQCRQIIGILLTDAGHFDIHLRGEIVALSIGCCKICKCLLRLFAADTAYYCFLCSCHNSYYFIGLILNLVSFVLLVNTSEFDVLLCLLGFFQCLKLMVYTVVAYLFGTVLIHQALQFYGFHAVDSRMQAVLIIAKSVGTGFELRGQLCAALGFFGDVGWRHSARAVVTHNYFLLRSFILMKFCTTGLAANSLLL
nr:MAG TPA: hypothetical protein [Caudoviricetes sp.]DAE79990.1 MAG TPA: hypothetical protein [Caudoviricetes sp.]